MLLQAQSPRCCCASRSCSRALAQQQGTAVNERVRRRRHPRRRPAARLRRHGLQLPAGEHRRSRSTSGACARRCARCTTPVSSATWSCAATATRWSSSVRERPSIESFEIKGNKDIKTEDLQKSLRNVGLAHGQDLRPLGARGRDAVPHRPVLRRGKYGVRIDTKVEELPGNRVQGQDRHQGRQARQDPPDQHRRQHRFTDEEILDDFELKTPNWLSWYKQNDRYSRESLQGDLEKLRSFYMDRGYANFQHRVARRSRSRRRRTTSSSR